MSSSYTNSIMLCKTLHWQEPQICSLSTNREQNSPPLQAWIQETSTNMPWEKAFPWERSRGDTTDPGCRPGTAEGRPRSLLPSRTRLMARVCWLLPSLRRAHPCSHSHPSLPHALQPHHSEERQQPFELLWRKQLKSTISVQKWDSVNSHIQCARTSERNLLACIQTLASLQCSTAGQSHASWAEVPERKGAPHSTLLPSLHGEMDGSLQREWNWGFTKWWNKAQGGYLWRGWLVRLCWVYSNNRVKGMELKNNVMLQHAFQGALQPQSLQLMLVNT